MSTIATLLDSGYAFIEGEFHSLTDRLEVTEKASGAPLGSVGLGTLADLDRTVRAAETAQRDWAERPYTERAALLRQVAALLAADADAVVELIMRETGSIRGKAEYEVNGAIEELFAGAALAGRPRGEILASGDPQRFSVSERVPVGVVAAITPWNFPLILAMRVIGPAIGLGNSVVLKPSPETPLSGGLIIADLFRRAGAPNGLFQVVSGQQSFSEALTTHPGVSMVHFTGSTAVGSSIAAAAGGALKRVSLELGGNNAFVVLDDADADSAAMLGAWSSFHYQGQTCISAGRHIVHESLFDDYVANLAKRASRIRIGDTLDSRNGLGPIINQRQIDRAHRLLDDSVSNGAVVVEGGTSDGLFLRPTIVTDVPINSPLWCDEIFAPIVPVRSFVTDDEAIELVNDTRYGLVNAVITSDEPRGQHFARQVRSGMVHINDATCLDESSAPFGGLGASGLGGRSGGEANLEEYTERRWVTAQRGTVEYPY